MKLSQLKNIIINQNFEFNEIANELYNYQAANNSVFKKYLSNYSLEKFAEVENKPFLPISAFKHHNVVTDCSIEECDLIFKSSGTTQSKRSTHFVKSKNLYLTNAKIAFENQYGSLKDWCILALLPSYQENKNSSLIAMVNFFMQASAHLKNGYFLKNYDSLFETIMSLEAQKQPTLLIGVSFALWEFAAQFSGNFNYLKIMETGGMKGKRKEITRAELHKIITSKFMLQSIDSEYGMCELLSQSYSTGNGIFYPAKTKKVIAKSLNDPMEIVPFGAVGKINIIDLANLYSCSFIETEDLGRVYENGSFEILGRIDNSDLRGCNLMF